MKSKSIDCQRRPFLLAAICLVGLMHPARTKADGVTADWSTRVQGPEGVLSEAAGIAIGPTGDVFVVGHVMNSSRHYDLLLSRHGAGGDLIWQRRFTPADGATADELATAIVAQGTNVYVAGVVTGSNGNPDILTLKYRDSGELEWAARFDRGGPYGDHPVALAVDGAGNVVVGGESSTANTGVDITVLKYDLSGALMWSHFHDGTAHSTDRLTTLRMDAAGNIYVAGNSASVGYRFMAATLKLDADGHQVWLAEEGSSYAYTDLDVSGMDVDSAGRVVTAGTDRVYAATWSYDESGQRRWSARHRAEEGWPVRGGHVRFDGAGNVIHAISVYGSGVNDAVVVKYAPDGQQLWATRVANGQGIFHAQALDLDAAGNAYFTAAPGTDAVTVKVGADGSQLWSTAYDSGDGRYDSGQFLKVDPAGNVFVATRSAFFSDIFVSLVKYTQQPVPGLPIATVTPVVRVVDPGATVTFAVEATGNGPLGFQWRKNGRALDGATNATLTLENVQAEQRGDYSVLVSGPAGATTSADARLSVRVSPVVTVDPIQTIGYLGTVAGFAARVEGNDFSTLQWRHNGTNIPGATEELLYRKDLNPADAGLYDVIVSTIGGAVTSSAAGLTVSGAVRLIGESSHRSHFIGWDDHPLLHVSPAGETIVVGLSNHPAYGPSLMLHKQDAAGALLWQAVFASPDFTNAQPSALRLDAAGNIYVAGVSLQPYIPAASAVLKYSPNGNLLWFRPQTGTNQAGAFISALAVDPEGNSTLGILSFSGTTLIRRSSAGDVVWSSHDDSLLDDTLAVVTDDAGHSYVATTPRDTYIPRLRKLDASGATVWTRSLTNVPSSSLRALALDEQGNLITAGTVYGESQLEGTMFIGKYTPAGDQLWLRRTGGAEVRDIRDMKIGPGGEITLLTQSDDDFTPEQSGLTRLDANGQVRSRVAETEILFNSGGSPLALDVFGNAYVTGSGGRTATGPDVATAKYDAEGRRLWLVYHGAPNFAWEYGISLGVDAAGDVHVLGSGSILGDSSVDLLLLHYQQRDPRSTFRLSLVRDAGGTFHLATPATEAFRIESSMDLFHWTALNQDEAQRLLQPGATPFSAGPRRAFRLVFDE